MASAEKRTVASKIMAETRSFITKLDRQEPNIYMLLVEHGVATEVAEQAQELATKRYKAVVSKIESELPRLLSRTETIANRFAEKMQKLARGIEDYEPWLNYK